MMFVWFSSLQGPTKCLVLASITASVEIGMTSAFAVERERGQHLCADCFCLMSL